MKNPTVLANDKGASVWHGRSHLASIKEARIDRDAAAQEYIKYCKDFKKWFDRRMRDHGMKLTLHIKQVLRRLRDPELRRSDSYINSALKLFMTGVRAGQVSREQIYTAVDVIAAGLDYKAINILGPCQGGKTGTMTLLFFIEPLCHAIMTGTEARPILSLVNQHTLDAQIKEEFQNFVNLHAYFGIRNGTEYFVREYFDHLGYEFTNTHDWTDAVIRNSVAKISEFRRVLQECKERNLVPKIFIDEIHNGSAVGGVLDRWCGDLLAAAKDEDFDQCHFRFVSATPFETIHIPNLRCVAHWIGPGYMGFPWFLKYQFPQTDGYTMKLPEFHRYRRLFGCMELCRESYKDIHAWLKHQQGIKDRNERFRLALDPANVRRWRKYQRDFMTAIADIVDRLFHGDSYGLRERQYTDRRTGEVKRACGMCIRVASKNVNADDIADDLEKRLPANTAVIRGYGKHMKVGQSIQQMIDEQVFDQGHDSYVILVTGGARMGVYFPPSCAFFMDLTREAGNTTAFLQGLVGRAQGYNKDSVLLLSWKGYHDLEEYIHTEGTSTKRPGQRAEWADVPPGAPSVNIDILRKDIEGDAKFRALVKFFDRVDAILDAEVLLNSKMAGKANAENSKDALIALEHCFDLVEDNPECIYTTKDTVLFKNIKLLRLDYSTLQMQGRQLEKHWKGLIAQPESPFVSEHPARGKRQERRTIYDVKFGRRFITEPELDEALRRSKSVRQTRRTAMSDKTSAIKEKFQPQMLIVKDGHGGGRCVGITLTLQKPAKAIGDWVKPTDKSAPGKMSNEAI